MALDAWLHQRGVDVPQGWTLSEVHGICADGRVLIGHGIDPYSEPQALRAELPNAQ